MTDETKKPSGIIRPEADPAVPVKKPEHPDRACDTCDHSYFPHVNNDGGYCRLNPPRNQVFLVPPAIQGQAPRDLSVSTWPITYRTQFCGTGYRRKTKEMQ